MELASKLQLTMENVEQGMRIKDTENKRKQAREILETFFFLRNLPADNYIASKKIFLYFCLFDKNKELVELKYG